MTHPTHPGPVRERCPGCHTTGVVGHEPNGEACRAVAEERRLSQSDWQRDA